jgi:hypothetical protein
MYRLLRRAYRGVHIGEAKYYYVIRDDSTETARFTPARLVAIETSENLKAFVERHYPDLARHVLWRPLISRLFVLDNILETGAYDEFKGLYRAILDDLRRGYGDLKNHNGISRRRKAAIRLACQWNAAYRLKFRAQLLGQRAKAQIKDYARRRILARPAAAKW